MDSSKMENQKARRQRYFHQSLLFMAANSAFMAVGMATIWPNVLSADLAVSNATLHHTHLTLTDWQKDMVGSAFFMGSLPAFVVSGWLVRTLGRRWSMLIGALPGILGSLLLSLALNSQMLLAGRLLEGAMYGMLLISMRTYVVEIADTEIRGSAASLTTIFQQIGAITCIAAGIFLRWFEVPFIAVTLLTVYCLVLVPLLPESPTFLAIASKDDQAKRILQRLRGPDVNVDKVLEDLKSHNNVSNNGGAGLSFLLKWEFLRRILIVSGLFAISNFCGTEVVKANASRILKSSGLAMDEEVSLIFFTGCLFAGNLTMLLILDRLGRRKCLLTSLSLLVIAYGILGAYNYIGQLRTNTDTPPETLTMEMLELSSNSSSLVYYSNNNNRPVVNTTWTWVPLACLMLAAFSQALGAGPMPWILSSEYFPTTIRSQAMCVCALVASLTSFAALQLFTPMETLLTAAGRYWCYSATAALGIPYTLAFISETRGKTVG